ncbi:MAG: hypothetical protein ABWY27_09235 [Telluria sp.]
MNTLTRNMLIVVLGAAAILMVPLIAMQFTHEVAWGPFDFVVAAVLLIGAGLLYVVPASLLHSAGARVGLGAVVAIAFVLVWAELAVGVFGTRFAGS